MTGGQLPFTGYPGRTGPQKSGGSCGAEKSSAHLFIKPVFSLRQIRAQISSFPAVVMPFFYDRHNPFF